VEVSGIDAVRIPFGFFFWLRSAGPALLSSLVALTVLTSLIPPATAVGFAALVGRVETIAGADLVLVLDGARVLEHGTHEKLLATGGRYADLHRIQEAADVPE
jgi:hypothetical protein